MQHQESPLLQSFYMFRSLLKQVGNYLANHNFSNTRANNLLLDRMQRLLWVTNNWLDQQKYHVVLPLQQHDPEETIKLLTEITSCRSVLLQTEQAVEGCKHTSGDLLQHPSPIAQIFDRFQSACNQYMDHFEDSMNGLQPNLQKEFLEHTPFSANQELNRKWQHLATDFDAMEHKDASKILKAPVVTIPGKPAKQPGYGFANKAAV